MSRPTILQIRLDSLLSAECGDALNALGYQVVNVSTRQDFERLVTSTASVLAIVDDAESVASWAIADVTGLSAVVLTTTESETRAVRALRLGALDYFRWPGERAAFLARVQQLVPARDDSTAGRAFVGQSAAIRRVQHQIEKVAATDCNVLVVGETGTGKELAAGLVHGLSPRAGHPFVAVNCAAIPDTLLESELFGHDRGAFTGAIKTYEGKLRQADRGTLFLDEVGDMSLLAQAKVLRAFESRTVVRVGGRTPLPVNVRFVAATNIDLAVASGAGRFRPDLFYRLNVAEVNIPPLRDRPEDIGPLVDHYTRCCNQRFQRRGQAFAKDVIQGFEKYAWPGNYPTATQYKLDVASAPGGPYTAIDGVAVPGYNQNFFPPPTNIDLPPPGRLPVPACGGWYNISDIPSSDGGPVGNNEKTLMYWPSSSVVMACTTCAFKYETAAERRA